MKVFYVAAVAALAFSCGSSTGEATTENAKQESTVKVFTVNEADWVETDLGPIAPMLPISVKLPKDAVLEKNGNGGVDVKINDYYVITVSASAVSSLEELVSDAKSLTVDRTDYYEGAKLLVDEPTGFVYTYKGKDEGTAKYEPESHFFYGLEVEGGAFFSFQDNQAFGSLTLIGSDFPAETAKKVYDLIKASAHMN